MSKENQKSKEFYELQTKWYKRLAKDGFKDIEVSPNSFKQSDNYPHLRDNAYRIRQRFSPEIFNHYQNCRYFAIHGDFSLKTDKTILKLYGNGKTYKEISKHLRAYCITKHQRKFKRKPYSDWYVHDRLKKLLNQMKTFLATQELENIEKFKKLEKTLDNSSEECYYNINSKANQDDQATEITSPKEAGGSKKAGFDLCIEDIEEGIRNA